MKMWKRYCAGLAVAAGLTTGVHAQPGLPAPPPAVPAVPVAPAAPPATLWSFLGISKPQMAACKEQICKTQIGQLMNNGMAPISALSGGLISGCCPPFYASDLLMPPGSAQGVAAAIKKDEAGARRGSPPSATWRRSIAVIGRKRPWHCGRRCARTATSACASRPPRRWAAAAAVTKSLSKRSVSRCPAAPATATSRRVPSASAKPLALPWMAACRAWGPCRCRWSRRRSRRNGPRSRAKPVPPPKPDGLGSASAEYYNKTVAAMSLGEVVQDARKAVERPKIAGGVAVAMKAPRGEAGVVGIIMGSFTPVTPSTAAPPVAVAEKETPTPPESEIKTVSYQEPAPAAAAASPFMQPMVAPKPAADPNGLMLTLRKASYPEDRLWAAQGLAGIDGRMNPQAINALMTAARNDSAAAVRAECVRTLTTTGVGSGETGRTVPGIAQRPGSASSRSG